MGAALGALRQVRRVRARRLRHVQELCGQAQVWRHRPAQAGLRAQDLPPAARRRVGCDDLPLEMRNVGTLGLAGSLGEECSGRLKLYPTTGAAASMGVEHATARDKWSQMRWRRVTVRMASPVS